MCQMMSFFFFQAEDGIRDLTVTGVQTCALPIWVGCTHAAPPWAISTRARAAARMISTCVPQRHRWPDRAWVTSSSVAVGLWSNKATRAMRSEEHTSELQSQSNLVCRLLLEKKKKTKS